VSPSQHTSPDEGALSDIKLWENLRRRYILDCDRPTLRNIAEQFGAAYSEVRKRAVKEKWTKLRSLAHKLSYDPEQGELARLLGQKAVSAILSAELSKPSEAARLLELSIKLGGKQKRDDLGKTQYIAEWGK